MLAGALAATAACAARFAQEPPAAPADAGCGVQQDGCPPAAPETPEPGVSERPVARRPPPGPARAQARPAPAPGGAETQPAAAAGAPRQPGAAQIAALLAAKAARTPAQRKIGSDLLARAASAAAAPPADRPPPPVAAGAGAAAGPSAPRVLVDIRADVTPALLARIRGLGGAVVSSVPRYRSVRARLPLAGLEPLAGRADVQWIRTADQPRIRTQPQRAAAPRASDPAWPAASHKVDTSEGDAAHRADAARGLHGVDGTGIGVGVISDGVETLAAQQATGDVPPRVTILPGQEGGAFDVACGGRSNGSEGTAMMEIVHDLAPGAELFFAAGGGGQAQMARNIEDLCTAGADVIVDDIGYLFSPAFQDGIIGRAVSAVTARGCHYFSAAGNGGNLLHGTAGIWEGDFAAGAALDLDGVDAGATYHDFGGGQTWNGILGSAEYYIILQWADPLGGSANDYDLFLIDANDNVLASSTNTQDGTQDPYEYFPGACGGEYAGARLVIVKNAGAADRYLRLDSNSELQFATVGHTFDQSASQHAVGVGAVRVPAGGGAFTAATGVEPFSSDGPRRVFFEADGTAITPGDFSSTGGRLLDKPDVAAANGVSTSTPGFPAFYGTSAAAPHAAAIGALMVEAAGGPAHLAPAALREALTGTALDILAPGVDATSGAGIAMAPDAVDAVDVAAADRNRAPTVARPLGDRTLAPGAGAVTIDLADVFDDPDGDALTYALRPVPGALAVLSGSVLTLAPGAPGAAFTVTVSASDPGGLTTTRTFTVGTTTPGVPCAYTVTPRHLDVLWTAGTGQVAVATAPGCAWTAASESAFLAVTAGAAGSGPGTVRYAVAANAGGPRRGALAVAGRRVTFYQASATAFTDHPLGRGVTPIRAIHFLELRARIDALLVAAGWPAYRWTDPVLTPGATPIRRLHLTELREALDQAYLTAGRPAPAYTDPQVDAGATVVAAAHLMELRAAVTALE